MGSPLKRVLTAVLLAAMAMNLGAGPALLATGSEQVQQAPIEARLKDTLSQLTLEEKAGQMVQAEIGYITPGDVTAFNVGSVFCGGDQHPPL